MSISELVIFGFKQLTHKPLREDKEGTVSVDYTDRTKAVTRRGVIP